MVTRHATGQGTTLSGSYGGTARATEGHTTLPVPDEVFEVIVDVSREIFHFNILTSASISRHG